MYMSCNDLSIAEKWTIYHEGRTKKRRNDLVVHYLPLASYQANRVRLKVPRYFSQEELFGAASFGLIDAVEAFDPKRKTKFETFSVRRINGAIIDWLRELDKQFRIVRAFENKKGKVLDVLIQNGPYTDHDVAQRMGLSDERFHLMNGLSSQKEVHLSTLAGDRNDRDDPYEIVDDQTPHPAHTIKRQFFREFIIKGLSRVDRMVIMLYYFESLKLVEIADMLDLCESRLGQIKKQALDRIRRNLKGTVYEQEYLLLA